MANLTTVGLISNALRRVYNNQLRTWTNPSRITYFQGVTIMAGNIYTWSVTAADNDDADPAINWAENQAPGTVNNSARGMMSGISCFIKDNDGSLTTGGTSSAYTVSINTPVTALVTGMRLTVKMHITNAGACTLTVTSATGASLGAKAIRLFTGVESDPVAAQLVLNGVYDLVYDSTASGSVGAWLCLNATQALWSTGDAKMTFKTSADPGWILVDDGTIGNAVSNASTRANADTVNLFTLLYNNVATLVVNDSTGAPIARGANAATDYAANRQLVLPKTLGRSLAVAGTGATLTARTLGATAGAETETPTQAKTASHVHTFSAQDPISAVSGGGSANFSFTGGDTAFTVTAASVGGGTPLNILDPSTYLNVMVKL